MNLTNARILLTGASGGIGRPLALQLSRLGARLALVGRNSAALNALAAEIEQLGGHVTVLSADVSDRKCIDALLPNATRALGGIDILINNAGSSEFGEFPLADPAAIESIIRTNLLGPLLLTRAVMPELIAKGRGQIVNVGSMFGSIGFAFSATYSASKFGLRGFSEALRRELEDTGVVVTYVAPRAVKTAFNAATVHEMAPAIKMKMDDPEWVAGQIVAAIEHDAKDVYLGWPEKFFARLNAILPRWVDGGLRKQNRIMREFAQRALK